MLRRAISWLNFGKQWDENDFTDCAPVIISGFQRKLGFDLCLTGWSPLFCRRLRFADDHLFAQIHCERCREQLLNSVV